MNSIKKYRVIIIGKDGKSYKKNYKYKPPIYKGTKRDLPKGVKKMYSFGFMNRVADVSLEEYDKLPPWK